MERKALALCAGIIITSLIISVYFYPALPEKFASHWNAKGEVNGYVDRFWGAFAMPMLLIFFSALFYAIPKIDPKKANIMKMGKYYEIIVLAIMLFLLYLHILTIMWNIGIRLQIGQMVMPAVGVLFFVIGKIMPEFKQNWFMGIRTPWTLSSKSVWAKTHKLGGRLFMVSGVVAVTGMFFERAAIWFVLAPIVISAATLFIYSYLEYEKEQK
ncbi:MAG: SdpI family protein [Candidatus Micrarchaeota archaeon]|nr:SdpI family protein [Candidatus Micrarchaeota archaeon]